MPSQRVLAHLGHAPGEFANTERACAEVLSIPVHSELGDGELVHVVEAMRAALAEVERG
jgi:dTDP-4-amino-4,6-dideoxygalactose transaminase